MTLKHHIFVSVRTPPATNPSESVGRRWGWLQIGSSKTSSSSLKSSSSCSSLKSSSSAINIIIMIMNRDRVTLASQRVADHHLADRLRDTTSWRSELASELDRNRQGQLWPWQSFKLSFKTFLSFPYEPLQAGLLLKIQIGNKVFFRNQTNLLLKTRAQLEHAMKETEHPLRVNSENIYTRWI